MRFKITARWVGCELIGLWNIVDLIQFNNVFYLYAPQVYTNEQLEHEQNNPENLFVGLTREEIERIGDPMGVFKIIDRRDPDWPPKPKCECGSEKVYGAHASHSDWCPRNAKG